MALIKCPDCEKSVSDQAPACPHCGSPVRAHIIEKTSKKYKGQQLLGAVLIAVGIMLAIVGKGEESDFLLICGGMMGIAGGLIYLFAGIGAWWEHG